CRAEGQLDRGQTLAAGVASLSQLGLSSCRVKRIGLEIRLVAREARRDQRLGRRAEALIYVAYPSFAVEGLSEGLANTDVIERRNVGVEADVEGTRTINLHHLLAQNRISLNSCQVLSSQAEYVQLTVLVSLEGYGAV